MPTGIVIELEASDQAFVQRQGQDEGGGDDREVFDQQGAGQRMMTQATATMTGSWRR